MCNMISCLVGPDARVYAKDGEHSHNKKFTEVKIAAGKAFSKSVANEYIKYEKAEMAVWLELFRKKANRIKIWRS